MATTARTIASAAPEFAMRPERSLWLDAWKRLKRNKAAVVSIVVIGVFLIVAIFAPLLAPHNPIEQTSNNSLRQPAWVHSDNPTLDGRIDNLLGTDALGRDVFSRLVYGARVSFVVGFIPQIFIVLVGVSLGLISGFAGGWLDNLVMRVTDIVYAFPDTLFIITIATAFRETAVGQAFNGLLLVFVGLSVISWTTMARLVRGQALSLKEKEFVEAARAVGVPTWKILLRHILPNTLGPIIVTVTFGIPGAIIAEAVLTFLGVGMRPSLDPTTPFPTSWGLMIFDGYANISSGPWLLFFPVLFVGLMTMAFTFLGDGLRDALDPREQ